jgi:hypothetical protein
MASEKLRLRAGRCIGFHEKVFKLKFGFTMSAGELGSCFHADSGCFVSPGSDPVTRWWSTWFSTKKTQLSAQRLTEEVSGGRRSD